MTGWTVYTSWRASGSVRAGETLESHPDWSTARRQALHLAFCNGARYVSVQSPDDVVVGEYDRYTNRWREYVRPVPSTPGPDLAPDVADSASSSRSDGGPESAPFTPEETPR